MKKIGTLVIIYAVVVVVYLLMMALQPFTNAMVETANATVNATTYPETQAVLVGWPFYAYIVPGGIAIIATIAVLKGNEK